MSSTSSSYCLQVKATAEKIEIYMKKNRKKSRPFFSSWFHLCGLLCWGIPALGDLHSCHRAEGGCVGGVHHFLSSGDLKIWCLGGCDGPRGLWMCLCHRVPENEHGTSTESESRALELSLGFSPA